MPGKISTPSASASVASQRQTFAMLTMKLPWLFIRGGIGQFGIRSCPAGPSM